MKIKTVVWVFLSFQWFICCGQTHNKIYEESIERMLKEFYTSHFSIWKLHSEGLPLSLTVENLDSLFNIYCTPKIRTEAVTLLLNDYGTDLLTNDFIGDINQNIEVKEISKNIFLVSFDVTYLDSPGGAITERKSLFVTIVKIDGLHKISAIN
jgi:hypothetical protein